MPQRACHLLRWPPVKVIITTFSLVSLLQPCRLTAFKPDINLYGTLQFRQPLGMLHDKRSRFFTKRTTESVVALPSLDCLHMPVKGIHVRIAHPCICNYISSGALMHHKVVYMIRDHACRAMRVSTCGLYDCTAKKKKKHQACHAALE